MEKKRVQPLKDDPTEDFKVTADLRDQIVKDLFRKLKDDGWGQKVVEKWRTADAERSDWLTRQETYLSDFDEFLESTAEGPFEQASSLHLPMPFIMLKTLHARFLQALLGAEAPFHTQALNEASVDRAPVVHELMRYMIDKHMNKRQGVFKPIDLWLWSWASSGVGFLKAHWDKKYIVYKDVEEQAVPGIPRVEVAQDGTERLQPTTNTQEVEVDRKELLWEGPTLSYVFPEDIIIIGENVNDDPQTADTVIHKRRVTEEYLWSMVAQKIFDREAVEKVLKSGANEASSDNSDNIKQRRVDNAGQQQLNSTVALDRYEILECYTKAAIDDTGIFADVVIWVHTKSMEILRATYLHRINKNGKRPIFKADFLRRPGQPYSMGLAEVLHPLSVEMDAMHNMRIDFGLLATMPFGFYRPTSSIDPKVIKLEPGALIPVDNPQSDINFPNLGNRTSFGTAEEAMLQQWAERLTGISDMSLGVLSSQQGATRTATGVRGLIGELNANLDVFLRRLNEAWGQVLNFILDLLQQRLPSDFVFRVTGDSDLCARWVQLATRAEIRGNFDIEVSPNSASSNQQIQVQRADEILQLTSNPLDFQLGIITPLERYEAIKNSMKSRGIKDVSKFIRKPENMERQLTPEEEANRILRGVSVPVTPMMDHAGFLAYVNAIQKDEQWLGQFTPEMVEALVVQARKHQEMLVALRQLASQQRNRQQLQTNANIGQQVNPAAPTGGTPFGEGVQ